MTANQGCARTNLTEMRGKQDQSLAFNQSFRNTQRNRKSISSAGPSAKFVNNSQTIFVNVSEIVNSEAQRQGKTQQYLRINAVSLISDANVETLASMLSSIETRANN